MTTVATPAVSDVESAYLSPRQLARALGVSESTIKRWVDAGSLPAARTEGGHRRIASADALRFVRARGAPIVAPELLAGVARAGRPVGAPAGPLPADLGEALFQALQADDPGAVRALVLDVFAQGGSLAVFADGPLRGALARIGELWRHARSGVAIEHRAVDIVLQALAELQGLLPASVEGAPCALGAAPGGDPYLLPSFLAGLVLRAQGFDARNLGPDTPAAVLREAAERYRPRLVWFASAGDARPASEVTRELRLLARLVASWAGDVVVGGRGLPPLGRLPGNVHHFQTMAELAAFAEGLRAVPSA